MQFFIADTHFLHQDLLGMNDFAPRPFPTVEAMDEAMITAWNARVDDNDIVYHLGDIAFNPEKFPTHEQVLALLTQLNGQIVFVKGNHDYESLFKFLHQHDPHVLGKPKFVTHDVGVLIKDDHTQFIMTHYPLLLGITKQTLNLHGHIHHSSVPIAENINVGVDAPERELLSPKLPFGAPLSAQEIHTLFTLKQQALARSMPDQHDPER